jgi:hypothetical protein
VTDALRRRVANLWRFRARFELEAEARFRDLAADLSTIGAPPELVALAARSADDERRHAKLAARLAARFGLAVALDESVTAPRIAPAGLDEHRRTIYDAVALCAVMESVSAAMLREMRTRATDPEAREVIHAILTDEITHSRIGWGTLAHEAERRDVTWLGPYIAPMLAGTVTEEIFEAPEGEAGAELEPWGGLRREARRTCFVDAAEGLVLAGLAHFGVPVEAGHDWLCSQVPAGPTA